VSCLPDQGKLGGTQRGHKDTNINGFDFPTLVQTPNGLIHVAYATKHYVKARKQSLKKPLHSFVKYVAVDEAWVQAGVDLPNNFGGVYQGALVAVLFNLSPRKVTIASFPIIMYLHCVPIVLFIILVS
jgi:hypothetical protein